MLKTVFIIALSTVKLLFPGMVDTTLPYEQATPASKTITLSVYSNQQSNTKSKAKVFAPKGFNRNKPIDLISIAPENDAEDLAALKLPQASHFSWPSEFDSGVKYAPSAIGKYRLDTNFAGTALVNIDANQDYLDELKLSYPENPDLTKAIKFSWEKVPRAAAYVCYGVGGKDSNSINWNSSTNNELPADFESNAISPAKLDEYIKAKVFLPADATQCMIPENIFSGCNIVMLSVVAIGNDSIQSNLGVTSKVVLRSNTTVVLKSGQN